LNPLHSKGDLGQRNEGRLNVIKLVVIRDVFTDASVTSEILLDGTQRWYGLEPPNRPVKPCCIPPGTFKVVLAQSKHFDMIVPVVLEVPNFTGVEIHPGNFPRNTLACLLIGEARGPDDVTQSRAAFDELMAVLVGQDDIQITYVGGYDG
jgi:hypothetical protein